jgi:hypothetical protein
VGQFERLSLFLNSACIKSFAEQIAAADDYQACVKEPLSQKVSPDIFF